MTSMAEVLYEQWRSHSYELQRQPEFRDAAPNLRATFQRQEAALTKAGYFRYRTVASVAEAETLNDNAVILAKGGHLFRKYDNWFREGVNAWIRNQWGTHCYPESAASLARDEWAHFPAIVIHEGDEK